LKKNKKWLYYFFFVYRSAIANVNLEGIFSRRSDFHKMKHLINEKDKTFEIQICAKSFFLSPEQALLLSNSAFKLISKIHQTFIINKPEFLSTTNLVQCFSQLFSLIEDKEEININSNNYSIFQY
jgi:hypothetical protein